MAHYIFHFAYSDVYKNCILDGEEFLIREGEKMRVNICGVPHKVIEKDDNFTSDNTHLGEITYSQAEILINKNIPEAMKKETLCHEMVHGIFVHLGREDMSNDETLVQQLGNAIYQGFEIKGMEEEE